MATVIGKEEIIKAARAMSKEDRLRLIAEIAALPESPASDERIAVEDTAEVDNEEVMTLTNQFISKHKNLLKRLAE